MSAPINPTINLIDQLIADGKLEEAQAQFSKFLDACEEEKDDLLQTQSRLSYLNSNEMLGIVSGDLQRNKIAWDFSTQLRKFRREILARYFDIRNQEDYFKQITDRDSIIKDILEIRIEPKNFQIEELIVEGNSSLVYRLFNNNLNRHAVALVLKIPRLSEQAKLEIESLSDLRHRNLIKLIDYDLSSYPYFVITEFVYGANLLTVLETTGRRPVAQTIDWLYQLADTLDYLRHKRIFHANVRPSKIYVDDEWQLMLSPLDMHLIVTTGESSYNRYLDVVKYGSPEALVQFGKKIPKEQDLLQEMRLSDQYALGLIGYKILVGEDLFEGTTVHEIIQSRKQFEQDKSYRKKRLAALPKSETRMSNGKKVTIDSILVKLLEEDPTKRFHDLHEVLRAFHPFTRTDYEDVSLARNSYRRCLAINKGFIRDFYAAFFKKVPGSESDFNFIGKKRQLGMLQMAVDVLLDIDNKQNHLLKMMGASHHQKYGLQDFEVFIDVLIETIQHNDPLYDIRIGEEWQLLCAKTIKVIQEGRASKVD